MSQSVTPRPIDADTFISKLAAVEQPKNHGVANMNLFVLPPCPEKGQEILIAIEGHHLSLVVPTQVQ